MLIGSFVGLVVCLFGVVACWFASLLMCLCGVLVVCWLVDVFVCLLVLCCVRLFGLLVFPFAVSLVLVCLFVALFVVFCLLVGLSVWWVVRLMVHVSAGLVGYWFDCLFGWYLFCCLLFVWLIVGLLCRFVCWFAILVVYSFVGLFVCWFGCVIVFVGLFAWCLCDYVSGFVDVFV